MKKVFKIENLDCAHCAAKVEKGISKIKGVSVVTLNFIMGKLTIEAPDDIFDSVLEEAKRIAKRVEPDCVIK